MVTDVVTDVVADVVTDVVTGVVTGVVTDVFTEEKRLHLSNLDRGQAHPGCSGCITLHGGSVVVRWRLHGGYAPHTARSCW